MILAKSTCIHVFGANFHLVQLRYYAHFWHYAGWQELAKVMLLQKADSNSCLDSQTYDGGSQITAAVLFASSCQPAKNGRNIEV